MNRTVTVVTPENITITYQAAGIASRFMAVVVDLFIQISVALLVLLGIQSVIGSGAHSSVGPASLLSTMGTVFIGIFLPFVYAIFFEMLWGGRTPGKRLFGLRTMRDGGYPLDLLSSVVRNVLRIIDFGFLPMAAPLVLCGLPGLVCIFLSPTYKRIGDYAAGTVVVVDSDNSLLAPSRQYRPVNSSLKSYLPLVKNIDRITHEEYVLIGRFLERSGQLDYLVQAGLAERLAAPLLVKLDMNLPVLYQLQYVDLLQAIEQRYAQERGTLT